MLDIYTQRLRKDKQKTKKFIRRKRVLGITEEDQSPKLDGLVLYM